MKNIILIIFMLLLSNSIIKAQDPSSEANTDYSIDKLQRKIDSLDIIINSFSDIQLKVKDDSTFKSILLSLNHTKDSIVEMKKLKEKENSPDDLRTIFGWDNKNSGTAVGNFWNDLDKKSGVISLGLPVFESRSTLYGEALLDYLGAFRFALSTAITASKLSDTNITAAGQDSVNKQVSSAEAIQNFITSGGNILIKSDFPLFFLANMSSKLKEENRNTRSIGIFASCRLSLNAPAFGGSANITDGLGELAIEPIFQFQTNEKLIGFIARFRFGVAVTSEDKVQTFTSKTDGSKTFGYIMTSVTLKIKDSFSINFNAPVSWWNSERPIDRAPVSLTIGTNF